MQRMIPSRKALTVLAIVAISLSLAASWASNLSTLASNLEMSDKSLQENKEYLLSL